MVIHLPEAPRLMWPTAGVRASYLVGEQADCLLDGTPADWLGPASEDFAGFVARQRGVRTRWGVPSTRPSGTPPATTTWERWWCGTG